jgi:hypothetical protein
VFSTRKRSGALNLKTGEWVEVRSRAEILATLDERGCFGNLPFMPEMLRYCGKKFRVFKRADKTCDPAHTPWSIRRMTDSVHLEALRCDGADHGGCEAGCLIFWKEAWLKRVEPNTVSQETLRRTPAVTQSGNGLCTVESIRAASQATDPEGAITYSCQATELRSFTSYMKSWDPRQYIRDLRSGNLSSGLARDSRKGRALEMALAIIRLLHALTVGMARGGYPLITGTQVKTSSETLDLQPGELVQVRSKAEIEATLNQRHRNRGLLFDTEMVTYCGGIFRVLRRVQRIIDENTGKMLHMKHPCIILDGVACRSDFHRLCPRAIYHYWRENWLMRASGEIAEPQRGLAGEDQASSCTGGRGEPRGCSEYAATAGLATTLATTLATKLGTTLVTK